MDLGELVLLADRIGIVAFAIAGVSVGVARRMDVFGLLAIGLTTAIGGGAPCATCSSARCPAP